MAPFGMKLLERLMMPANTVCDRFGLTEEHERGMMRMLVNMIICTGMAVIAFFVGWKLFA